MVALEILGLVWHLCIALCCNTGQLIVTWNGMNCLELPQKVMDISAPQCNAGMNGPLGYNVLWIGLRHVALTNDFDLVCIQFCLWACIFYYFTVIV